MGRSRQSSLAPLLRSEALARVLATTLLSPETLYVRAIADRAELPYSVVQREVDRLEEAGLVMSKRVGRSRMVLANDRHPLFAELRALLLKTYGPRDVLADLLHGEEGVVEAYIYGSWAARYAGDWGGPPADVDVLVVGDVPPTRREEIEAQAQDRIGQPVQIVVIPPSDWDAGSEPFIRTVKQRPMVPLEGGDRA